MVDEESAETPPSGWILKLLLNLRRDVQTCHLVKFRVLSPKGLQGMCKMIVYALTTEQVAAPEAGQQNMSWDSCRT